MLVVCCNNVSVMHRLCDITTFEGLNVGPRVLQYISTSGKTMPWCITYSSVPLHEGLV